MAHLDSFKRRAVAFGLVAALFVLGWFLADVAVMIFGGIIIATALSAMAGGVSRLTALPDTLDAIRRGSSATSIVRG